MSTEESVDQLVDKAIDEALARFDKDSDEIKKRKPKPYRYITDQEEIKAALTTDGVTNVSVMKESTTVEIVEEKLAIIGLGDVQAIENVIKKHEASRKFTDK